MAVAIMGGLIVATALTLLALPAMYAAWFRVKRETMRRLNDPPSGAARRRQTRMVRGKERNAPRYRLK